MNWTAPPAGGPLGRGMLYGFKEHSFLYSQTVRYNYTVLYLFSYTVLFHTVMTRARGFTDQGFLFWWTFLRYGFSDVRPGRILSHVLIAPACVETWGPGKPLHKLILRKFYKLHKWQRIIR